MKLLEESTIRLDFADMAKRRPITRILTGDGAIQQASRSPGHHISGVLRYLAIASKRLKPGSFEDEDPRVYPLLWALGVMWEEFAASFYPDMDYQPGELQVDGVWMTCDGLSLLTVPCSGNPRLTDKFVELPAIEEFKFTFKKLKTGKEFLEEWLWLHQGKAYCKGYGARLVRWHVCFVKGDYKTFGPIYRRYLIEFNEKEIEQTWAMISLNKDQAEAEGKKEEIEDDIPF